MSSEDNADIFPGHILNSIAEMRHCRKRPHNKFLSTFTQKNHSTNANFNFIEEAIKKLIKSKIVNKPTIQCMTSYCLISDDQLNENKVIESEPVYQYP